MRISMSSASILLNATEEYFTGRIVGQKLISSYYLLGFRENYLVGRLAPLRDLVGRVARVMTFGSVRGLDFWVLSWDVATLPTLAWFARTARINLFSSLGRSYTLIFQKDCFFSIRSLAFNINTVRFLGVDVALILTRPTVRGAYQLNAFRSFGIPTIGLGFDLSNVNQYTYQFLCSSEFSRLFVFFIRLFLCFFRA